MPATTPTTASDRLPRVLVADDQPDVLTALNLLLKNEGFAPDFANSPREVLEAVRSAPFDLLLLDMNYARDTTSGTEGLELLSKVHQYDDSLPIVLMTAWSTVDLAVEAMRCGGSDFVTKPWDNARLVETIRRNLSRHEAPEVDSERVSTSEVREAREIQRRLLPGDFPPMPGCDLHASWCPAAAIGGDYYDAIRLGPSSVGFCIADVSGKGLPAALLMANAQAAVRAAAESAEGPASVCDRVNRALLDSTPSEKFVTLFYGVLDGATGVLRYSNAGHLPPIVARGDGSSARLTEGGPVLGLLDGSAYREGGIRLDPGDRIVLCTDGITEATNPAGEEFGERRLIDLILRNRGCSSLYLHDVLLDAVRGFAGRLQDDLTLLTVTAAAARPV